MLETLLSHPSTDINMRTRDSDQTALMLAASLGREAFIQKLLSYGADVTLQDSRNMTALDYSTTASRAAQEFLQNATKWQPASRTRVVVATTLYTAAMILVQHLAGSRGSRSATMLQLFVSVSPVLWILSRHFQWCMNPSKWKSWLFLAVVFACQSLSSSCVSEYVICESWPALPIQFFSSLLFSEL